VTLNSLILDLPHRGAHGAADFLSSGSCRRYCSDSVSTPWRFEVAEGAKGRVQGGLWILARIAHAAAVAELLGLTAQSPSHLLPPSL
jgi:hypothetical protein